jgi:hypothetical protein
MRSLRASRVGSVPALCVVVGALSRTCAAYSTYYDDDRRERAITKAIATVVVVVIVIPVLYCCHRKGWIRIKCWDKPGASASEEPVKSSPADLSPEAGTTHGDEPSASSGDEESAPVPGETTTGK